MITDVVHRPISQELLVTGDRRQLPQRISLTGSLRRATPKTLRHRLLHVAAHVSPRRLRLDRHWPCTPTLTTAIEQTKARLRPLIVTIRPAIHP